MTNYNIIRPCVAMYDEYQAVTAGSNARKSGIAIDLQQVLDDSLTCM